MAAVSDERAEIVVRFEVTGDSGAFRDKVVAALRETQITTSEHTGLTVRLHQPLLASGSEEWELRISAANWAAAGKLVDDLSTSGTKDAPQARSLLSVLSRLEDASVVSAGAPLYRSWSVGPEPPPPQLP